MNAKEVAGRIRTAAKALPMGATVRVRGSEPISGFNLAEHCARMVEDAACERDLTKRLCDESSPGRAAVHTILPDRRANPKLPVGTRVAYFPVRWEDKLHVMEREGRLETTTRSEPWQLGHGAWVVSIVCKAGGVALEHLEVLD